MKLHATLSAYGYDCPIELLQIVEKQKKYMKDCDSEGKDYDIKHMYKEFFNVVYEDKQQKKVYAKTLLCIQEDIESGEERKIQIYQTTDIPDTNVYPSIADEDDVDLIIEAINDKILFECAKSLRSKSKPFENDQVVGEFPGFSFSSGDNNCFLNAANQIYGNLSPIKKLINGQIIDSLNILDHIDGSELTDNEKQYLEEKRQSMKTMEELKKVFESPRISKNRLKRLLDVGKRIRNGKTFWNAQDDPNEALHKILACQNIAIPSLQKFFRWSIRLTTTNITNGTSSVEVEHLNSNKFNKVSKSITHGLENYQKENTFVSSVDECQYTQQAKIMGDVPPICIFELTFRKQFAIIDDEEIESYKWVERFDIDLEFISGDEVRQLFGIICHSGMETESGHITCYIKHENNWYCHDDDKCVKVDIKTIQKTAGVITIHPTL